MVETSIRGVDVWDGYGAIDWPAVEASGVRFAYIRATGYVGKNGRDERTRENLAGIATTKIAPGIYHVWHEDQDPVRAADAAYEWSEGCGIRVGSMPPALDVETPPMTPAGLARIRANAQAIAAKVLRHVDAFTTRFGGRPPVIYTYPGWWMALGAAGLAPAFAGLELWVAHYTRGDAGPLALPSDPATLGALPEDLRPMVLRGKPWDRPWPRARMWQYSAAHAEPVPGIATAPCRVHRGCTGVDRNAFLGSEPDFARFLGMVPVEPNEEPGPIVRPDVPLGRPALDD